MNMFNVVSSFWSRLASSSLCELVELMGDKVPLPDVDLSRKDRVFNPWRTFWLFLGQILSVNQSCREALRKAQAWLCVADIKSNTRAKGTKTEPETNKKKHFIQHFCLLSGP